MEKKEIWCVGLVWNLADSRPRESQCFSCSLRAGQDWCPSSGSRAGASSHRQSPTVLFRPAVYWMGSLMLGRAICCTQSTDSCIIHSEKPSQHTQSNILKNVWALMAQWSWHVEVDCHKTALETAFSNIIYWEHFPILLHNHPLRCLNYTTV